MVCKMETDQSESGQTERVSADLLATSVSKSVLAKEVLRLKQVVVFHWLKSSRRTARLHTACEGADAGQYVLVPDREQLRDELVQSSSDSPSALAARCDQLVREIREEEELAARETAELAEQVCTGGESAKCQTCTSVFRRMTFLHVCL